MCVRGSWNSGENRPPNLERAKPALSAKSEQRVLLVSFKTFPQKEKSTGKALFKRDHHGHFWQLGGQDVRYTQLGRPKLQQSRLNTELNRTVTRQASSQGNKFLFAMGYRSFPLPASV